MNTETKIKELQSKIYTTAHEVEKQQALVKSLSKQLSNAESKVSDYFADLDEYKRDARSILEESKAAKPTVKPLFPRSWEEGALWLVSFTGEALPVDEFGDVWLVRQAALQGRTFYTREAAEAFAKRERARRYCLERINEVNEVNEGDNGFDEYGDNYIIEYEHENASVGYTWCNLDQGNEACEYIRTRAAAEQLINDPEFVENWKLWKGVE